MPRLWYLKLSLLAVVLLAGCSAPPAADEPAPAQVGAVESAATADPTAAPSPEPAETRAETTSTPTTRRQVAAPRVTQAHTTPPTRPAAPAARTAPTGAVASAPAVSPSLQPTPGVCPTVVWWGASEPTYPADRDCTGPRVVCFRGVVPIAQVIDPRCSQWTRHPDPTADPPPMPGDGLSRATATP